MSHKKLWSLLSLMLVFSMLLVACGNGAETPEPAAGDEMEDGDEIVITIAAGAVGRELEIAQQEAERYMEEHPNVRIELLETPDYVQDRLGVVLQYFEAQSSDLDVAQIDVIWTGDLADHLVDLNKYGADQHTGDHFQAIVKNNTVDGRLVAMPWFVDAGMLYYRTDLLEKYGYSGPPRTWEELTEMAQTIQDGERGEGNQDFWGFVWQGDEYEGLTCDALEWQYSNSGHNFVTLDREVMVTDPDSLEIFELAASWVGTISPPGVTGMGEEGTREIWQVGNAAFLRNWPYVYALSQGEDSEIVDMFDVSPLPTGRSGQSASTLGGWQLAVSKYSDNPEVAADVVFFLTGMGEQKIRAIELGNNPTIKSLYEDEEVLEASPFMGKLYDVFVNTVPRPSTQTAPKYNEVSTAYFTAIHSIITGEKDALTAMEECEVEIESIIATLD